MSGYERFRRSADALSRGDVEAPAPAAPPARDEAPRGRVVSSDGTGVRTVVRENGVPFVRWRLPDGLLADPAAAKAVAAAWRKSSVLHDEHLRECVRYDPDAGELVLKGDDWEPLDAWLERFPDGPVPEEYAFHVARALARTLDYVAGQKAFPRRFSPRDVRIEMRAATKADGPSAAVAAVVPEPLLEEFVIADAVRGLTGGARGPADEGGWRAPELAGGAPATSASLQWTLARMLYRMLSGRMPDDPPRPLRKLSKRRNAAFRRALSPNPRRRFASCRDFVQVAETGRRPGGTSRIVLALSAAILVAGGAGLAWQAKRIHDRPPATEPGGPVLSPEAEGWLKSAIEAESAGRWDEAIEAADKVLAENPEHAEAQSIRKNADQSKNREKKAEEQKKIASKQPWIRIEADRPGAWIVRDGRKIRLPTSFRLEPGAKAGPWDVAATVGGETWSGFVSEFTVEETWIGERTNRVALARGEAGSGAVRKRRTVTLPDGQTFSMIWCPPGTFRLGSRENAREVRLTKGFWLAETELTIRQWKAIKGRSPSSLVQWNNSFKHPPPIPDVNERPLENVSWEEATAFIGDLNRSGCDLGLVFRLPTEAEWEYACRAGTDGDFAGAPEEVAWFDKTARTVSVRDNNTRVVIGERAAPQPPKGKKPNAWGFFDMHGNVAEWCADAWEAAWWRRQPDGTLVDPKGPAGGEGHVVRGGDVRSAEARCASHARQGKPDPENGFSELLSSMQKGDRSYIDIGFRLAADEGTWHE